MLICGFGEFMVFFNNEISLNNIYEQKSLYILPWIYINTFTSALRSAAIETFLILNIKSIITTSVIVSIKFLILIALLIFIRGGVPRYRYDFLTKIGWIKFLNLVLVNFISTFLLVMVF